MNRDKTQVRRVAMVTGAARRIGAATAKMLHEAGYDVVIHCHQSQGSARALADALNAKRETSACVLTADLSIKNEAFNLVHRAYDWKKRFDVLVNNASVYIKTPLKGFDEVLWDTLWGVNVKAPFWLSDAAHPFLAQSNDGCIVNLSDIQTEKPRADYAVYLQTKAALDMQTRSLALEYAPKVRVNAVAPGATIEPEGANALTDEERAAILAKIPQGRWGAPQAVAQAILSFVMNPHITGQILRVDGGQSLV